MNRDGGLTVLDGEKVGGSDFTETVGVEVLSERSGSKGQAGRGGKVFLLVDEEQDVTVSTGSLERSGSDVVDAAWRRGNACQPDVPVNTLAYMLHLRSGRSGQVQSTISADRDAVGNPVEGLSQKSTRAYQYLDDVSHDR